MIFRATLRKMKLDLADETYVWNILPWIYMFLWHIWLLVKYVIGDLYRKLNFWVSLTTGNFIFNILKPDDSTDRGCYNRASGHCGSRGKLKGIKTGDRKYMSIENIWWHDNYLRTAWNTAGISSMLSSDELAILSSDSEPLSAKISAKIS